jgi:hypothetical protein
MAKGLQMAEPPRRRSDVAEEVPQDDTPKLKPQVAADTGLKFTQIAENEKVQFNKRVRRGVADGYEMLAIRTRQKVPELLEEALALLEQKYGKV